jgi:hypothetical protein
MPEVTVAEIKHNLTRKIHFLCPDNIVQNELIRSVLMAQQFTKLHSWRKIVWKNVRSAHDDRDAFDQDEIFPGPSAETCGIA